MSKYEEVMGALSAAQLCGVKGATNAIQTMHEMFGEVDVVELSMSMDDYNQAGQCFISQRQKDTIVQAAALVLEFKRQQDAIEKEQGNE